MADILDPEEDESLGKKDEDEEENGSQYPLASPRHSLKQFEMVSPRSADVN
jgi:hypothetical protein